MMKWGSRLLDASLKPKDLVLKTAQEKESSPKSSIEISVQAENMRTVSLGEFLTLDELTIIGDLAQSVPRATLNEDIERLVIKPNIYRIMNSLNQDVNSKQLAFAIAAAWDQKSRRFE